MNIFLEQQICNMNLMVRNFRQCCEMVAIKDDGVIDSIEENQLRKINLACDKFLKALNSIK